MDDTANAKPTYSQLEARNRELEADKAELEAQKAKLEEQLSAARGSSIAHQLQGATTSLLQAVPKKCSLREDGPFKGEIDSPITLVLQVVDCNGEPSGAAVNVVAKLSAVRDKSPTSCKVNEKDVGVKEIVCEPRKTGRYLLKVTVDSVEIPCSPFTMFVSDPSTSVLEPVKVIPLPDCPNCNRISITGTLMAVSTWTMQQICVFKNKDGELLRKFGSEGQDKSQFMHPNGVVVDSEGYIYVADWGNNRVQKFDSKGVFIKSVGSEGKGQWQFHSLTGMRMSREGKLYVCEYKNHRVQVFDRDLAFVTSFGTYGRGDGQLKYPEDVAFDSKGLVYVTDLKNSRIQVFDRDGTYVRQFGSHGSDQSKLKQPTGIYIDQNDMVYVTERGSHCISIFRPNGEYVLSFGTYGNDPGYFYEPLGISVDDDGSIYVCDSLNDRLQVF